MNFLFDGRMDVRDLPDEIRRVVRLLRRADVSHLYQVRLQVRLLKFDDELVVHPDEGDLRDIKHVPPLKEVVTIETFSDGFENENIEVSRDMSFSVNRTRHIAALRGFTGCDRGPPTMPRLLELLSEAYTAADLENHR